MSLPGKIWITVGSPFQSEARIMFKWLSCLFQVGFTTMRASIIRSKLKKKLLVVLDVSCLKGFARTKITTKMWVERCGKKEIERQVRGPGLAYYISPPRDFSNFMEDPLHAFCYILFVPSPQAKKKCHFYNIFYTLKDSSQRWIHLLELTVLFLAISPWCHSKNHIIKWSAAERHLVSPRLLSCAICSKYFIEAARWVDHWVHFWLLQIYVLEIFGEHLFSLMHFDLTIFVSHISIEISVTPEGFPTIFQWENFAGLRLSCQMWWSKWDMGSKFVGLDGCSCSSSLTWGTWNSDLFPKQGTSTCPDQRLLIARCGEDAAR